MKSFEGHYSGVDLRFAIVASRFNQPITHNLLMGALDCFKRHGVADDAITVVWVPGAFEIPLMAKHCAQSKKFDAVLCLGAIIRGQTPHFDFIASQAASGILQTSLSAHLPVIFSILTTNTTDEAEERSGIKGGNAGFHNALTALEMANLLKIISQ